MKRKYNLNLKEGVDFRVKRGHWFPRKLGAEYVVFGKTMYCRDPVAKVPKHEFLHVVQFNEYGVVRVLLHYLFHGTANLFRTRSFRKAFCEVPFEVEARDFEDSAGLFRQDEQD